MELKTFRASTMHEALAMVERELGADAAVLHTREISSHGWLGWLGGPRMIEVTASCDVNVPSRLAPLAEQADEDCGGLFFDEEASAPAMRSAAEEQVQGQLSELQVMVKQLSRRAAGGRPDLPEELFRLFTDLLDSDLSEAVARELVDRLRARAAEPGWTTCCWPRPASRG